MGIGAYTAAIFILGRAGLEGYGLDPPGWLPLGDGMRGVFTIPLAGLVAGVFGYAFGLPALRLAGVSLALATFAFAVSLPLVAKRFDERHRRRRRACRSPCRRRRSAGTSPRRTGCTTRPG